MSRALGPILTLCLGCAALQPRSAPPTIPITVHSHNRSDTDVYLLCGDRDAEWLGVVREKEVWQLEIPRARARCALGLNFFLVSRSYNRGYWVGPLHPVAGTSIALTIEKYAGLSSGRAPVTRSRGGAGLTPTTARIRALQLRAARN